MEVRHEADGVVVSGRAGSLKIGSDDEVGMKLLMLLEGECDSDSPGEVARRYGYCKQRYYQLLTRYQQQGTEALASRKRGPKTNYRRGGEVGRQIIRYRYLDPEASVEVVGQKLRQDGFAISNRSVFRVFADYGLQKKGSTNVGRGRRRAKNSCL